MAKSKEFKQLILKATSEPQTQKCDDSGESDVLFKTMTQLNEITDKQFELIKEKRLDFERLFDS